MPRARGTMGLWTRSRQSAGCVPKLASDTHLGTPRTHTLLVHTPRDGLPLTHTHTRTHTLSICGEWASSGEPEACLQPHTLLPPFQSQETVLVELTNSPADPGLRGRAEWWVIPSASGMITSMTWNTFLGSFYLIWKMQVIIESL